MYSIQDKLTTIYSILNKLLDHLTENYNEISAIEFKTNTKMAIFASKYFDCRVRNESEKYIIDIKMNDLKKVLKTGKEKYLQLTSRNLELSKNRGYIKKIREEYPNLKLM